MSNKTQLKKRRDLERAMTPKLSPIHLAVSTAHPKKQEDKLQILRVDQLLLDPNQPRTSVNAEEKVDMDVLVRSIRAEGLQQPITVTFAFKKDGVEYYYIKFGERRWRAHKIIGLEFIECLIRAEEYDGKTLSIDRLLKQSSENSARKSQSHCENIRVVRLTVEDAVKGIPINETYGTLQGALKRAADAHGKDASWAKNYHALSRLHSDLQAMLDHQGENKLNFQVAISLSGAPLVAQQDLLERSKPYFEKDFQVGLRFIAQEARLLREEAGHKMRGRQSRHKDNFMRFGQKFLRLSTQFQGTVMNHKEWLAYLVTMIDGMSVLECEQMAKTVLQASFAFAEAYELCEQKREQHVKELFG